MRFLSVLLFVFPVLSCADAPENWQIGFQDPATPVMQGLIDLHHDVFFFFDCGFNLCYVDGSKDFVSFSS